MRGLGRAMTGLLLMAAWTTATQAQSPPKRSAAEEAEATRPRAMDVYNEKDPKAELKRAIEKRLGVYLVHPPRRHQAERVRIKGKQAIVDVWHPVGNRSDTWLKARAVQWLIGGRTQWSGGARAVFSDINSINEVRLRFVDIVRPKTKGRRIKKKKRERIKPYLVLSVKRSKVKNVDLKMVETCVRRHNCNRLFSRSFSVAKLDKKYTAKRRKEG